MHDFISGWIEPIKPALPLIALSWSAYANLSLWSPRQVFDLDIKFADIHAGIDT
jgi:hypothetical protein